MLKAVSLFGRKKTIRPFKNFYAEWIETLRTTLLPVLRQSMSSNSPHHLLPTHVDTVHTHFQSYYAALDLAASSYNDVAQLLYPDHRNPLESPFLWLGDLHPYLFTNLLRSFLNDNDDFDLKESGERLDLGLSGRDWNVVTAWGSPSKGLTSRVEQIECGLRLMVPAISARFRDAQKGFVERVGAEWGRSEREEGAKGGIEEALEAEMDEMTGVFLDANRLRRSVLSDIMGATSVYQAALFLEGLAQFVVGLRDHELFGQFERCKMVINS
ncbi:hypothetical protein RHMOL_Rhmol07G0124300 [Rhododendron molle]|uniref:Uncharacterized protein n=1 Tax=Rhododendron molle TaxID=49168 RepID=A0ACC0MZN6_RHOML|nr:hypothetical protein RHMOL_Rhmol07G0124300 [Rhododendron molle]